MIGCLATPYRMFKFGGYSALEGFALGWCVEGCLTSESVETSRNTLAFVSLSFTDNFGSCLGSAHGSELHQQPTDRTASAQPYKAHQCNCNPIARQLLPKHRVEQVAKYEPNVLIVGFCAQLYADCESIMHLLLGRTASR